MFSASALIKSLRLFGFITSTASPCFNISLFISEKSETGKLISTKGGLDVVEFSHFSISEISSALTFQLFWGAFL
jgi:hypothetical protein